MHFDRTLERRRWLVYFDLLGTTRRLEAHGVEAVFESYAAAVAKLKPEGSWDERIRSAWFSDSFLVVAPDDSKHSFASVDQVARRLAVSLLLKEIPFRGAISCESFYADFDRNIFIGSALVEAHEFGEGQDWIGLVLCPSAASALAREGLDPASLRDYALADIPWKSECKRPSQQAFACILGDWGRINGKHLGLKYLRRMEASLSAEDERSRKKYQRTIQFIENNMRW